MSRHQRYLLDLLHEHHRLQLVFWSTFLCPWLRIFFVSFVSSVEKKSEKADNFWNV